MTTFLTVLHVLVCVFLILVVLLQAGKGGGMGIAFGGAGSQTVFGSSGAGNFLTRLTSVTAAVFMLTSLGLAHYSSQQDSRRLQKLAEQKKAQKQAEDARAAKLKTDLEKAAQSAPKTPAVPGTGGAAAAPSPEMPLKLTPPVQLGKPGSAPGGAPALTPPAAKGKPAAAPATDETPAPPKRKRKPKPPAEDGAKPAAAPAEAPPAPAQ
jgi:preprotein translocase subunit SecG